MPDLRFHSSLDTTKPLRMYWSTIFDPPNAPAFLLHCFLSWPERQSFFLKENDHELVEPFVGWENEILILVQPIYFESQAAGSFGAFLPTTFSGSVYFSASSIRYLIPATLIALLRFLCFVSFLFSAFRALSALSRALFGGDEENIKYDTSG